MARRLQKEAAGEFTARMARWLSTPIKGTPKLVQKVRTGPELDMLEQGVRDKAKQYVEDPIRRGLTKVKADKAIGSVAHKMPIKRNLKGVDRQEWAANAGKSAVDFIARKPHVAFAQAPIIPIPGLGIAAEGLDRLKTKFLNATPGLRVQPHVPKPTAIAPGALPQAANTVKLANGDMLEYFQKHPEKAEARKKRGKSPVPTNLSTGTVKTAEDEYETLEEAYWKFDALRAGRGRGPHLEGSPMAERDAFKTAVRGLEKTAEVLPYQQLTQWTCSAACLKAVLGHYGMDVPESLTVQAIGTREGRGAECDEIMRGAHKLGFDAFEYPFDSLEQAKWLLDQDIPIIADIQSFNNPGKGHYVVITAIDESGVHMMDPNTPGNMRLVSHEEMEDRWWDNSMAPPHDLMMKWAIVVLPPEGT